MAAGKMVHQLLNTQSWLHVRIAKWEGGREGGGREGVNIKSIILTLSFHQTEPAGTGSLFPHPPRQPEQGSRHYCVGCILLSPSLKAQSRPLGLTLR